MKRGSRRGFFKAMAAIGSTTVLPARPEASPGDSPKYGRLPREVWIAAVAQQGLQADTVDGMIDLVFGRMAKFESYEPDIVCLPEAFPLAWVRNRPAPTDIAEVPPGPITGRFAEYARSHGCYVVCPTYTRENGKVFNAAVLIDRKGKIAGEYRKIRPTAGEVAGGIAPGPLDPPVFDTDFGRIGMQICFDIEWTDAWRRLGEKGAEIVFWPSAFAGGKALNARAFTYRYAVISSTRKDTSKICDIDGAELARTGRWNKWACAPVNLEKAFLHTWPFVMRFEEIHRKYGSKVRITNHHEEEWSIIESRSPDIRVADILKEFDMKTMTEHLREAEAAQDRAR
ncbi:MAG: carbon-nitrogen hydrolase family protein [Candidatus Latescibacteria bacterium]|nr:carbon-nitrogen hydrolase family protein [Candidatus Latescibacterota bacterium]